MDNARVVREVNHRFAIRSRLRSLLLARRRTAGKRELATCLCAAHRAASLGLESLEVEFLHLLEFVLVLAACVGASRIVTYLVH